MHWKAEERGQRRLVVSEEGTCREGPGRLPGCPGMFAVPHVSDRGWEDVFKTCLASPSLLPAGEKEPERCKDACVGGPLSLERDWIESSSIRRHLWCSQLMMATNSCCLSH